MINHKSIIETHRNGGDKPIDRNLEIFLSKNKTEKVSEDTIDELTEELYDSEEELTNKIEFIENNFLKKVEENKKLVQLAKRKQKIQKERIEKCNKKIEEWTRKRYEAMNDSELKTLEDKLNKLYRSLK